MNYYNPYLNYPYTNTGINQFNSPMSTAASQMQMGNHLIASHGEEILYNTQEHFDKKKLGIFIIPNFFYVFKLPQVITFSCGLWI